LYAYIKNIKQWALPKIKTPAVSLSYLEKLLKNEALRVPINELKKPNIKPSITKQELIYKIQEIIRAKRLVVLGFDETNPADKSFLLKLLFWLNPLDECFKAETKIMKYDMLKSLDKEDLIHLLLMNGKGKRKKGIFKETKEQREKRVKEKIKKRLFRLKNKEVLLRKRVVKAEQRYKEFEEEKKKNN